MNVASVSRQHARLLVVGSRCTLSDAGSTYGTQLNGAPVKGEADLKEGDVFQCGAVVLTLEQALPTSQLLTDDHQLLQDSASIVLRCVEVFGDGLTREMLLASRLVSADRAYAVGAVMAVVPGGSLEAEVASVIDGVRQAARVTIEVTKEQLHAGAVGHDAAADDARIAKAYGGEDFREGVRAFLAKEQPRFSE